MKGAKQLGARMRNWLIQDQARLLLEKADGEDLRKGGHVRTIPMPDWVKETVDRWRDSAKLTAGRIFRDVSRQGTPWGNGTSENVIWYVVRNVAEIRETLPADRSWNDGQVHGGVLGQELVGQECKRVPHDRHLGPVLRTGHMVKAHRVPGYDVSIHDAAVLLHPLR